MSEISRHLRLIYEKTFQRLICKINIQKTFIWRRNLRQTIKIEKTTTYVTSWNIDLCTQLAFVFHPLDFFYVIHDHIDVSFLFLLQKDFCIIHEHIGAFIYILFSERFEYLSSASF